MVAIHAIPGHLQPVIPISITILISQAWRQEFRRRKRLPVCCIRRSEEFPMWIRLYVWTARRWSERFWQRNLKKRIWHLRTAMRQFMWFRRRWTAITSSYSVIISNQVSQENMWSYYLHLPQPERQSTEVLRESVTMAAWSSSGLCVQHGIWDGWICGTLGVPCRGSSGICGLFRRWLSIL